MQDRASHSNHSVFENLIPTPRRIRLESGQCPASAPVETILGDTFQRGPESYRLRIGHRGITIEAGTGAGSFYAKQTLEQIRQLAGQNLPCVTIEDWPDYAVRGFYHDISRGKVPTLQTLLDLAETCASLKINHLQLYIEHTFAFKNHPEVWQGADPLTADEIRTLDARCAELHIDLVPSLSTFGHFYTWIRQKFPELNELERDVSGDAPNWWDRQMHYTLDCRNPRSLALVDELIRELRPLFRSGLFNICADETFDLGTGRNRDTAAKVGKGRLYVDFLKQIMQSVKNAGAVPMFWGDVIRHHPELLSEIPREAIALDWDYAAAVADSSAEQLASTGRAFYVCPGIQSWNRWLPDFATAGKNIVRLAKRGRKFGAMGLLNTDWGDFGHIQTLGPCLHGLALGASVAWNPTIPAVQQSAFDEAVSRLLWKDTSGSLAGLLRKAGSQPVAKWATVTQAHEPRSRDFTEELFDARSGLPSGFFEQTARAHAATLKRLQSIHSQIEQVLRDLPCEKSLLRDEVRTALLGLEIMEELHLLAHRISGRTRPGVIDPARLAHRLRQLDSMLTTVWQVRNKPSELERVRRVLRSAADQAERENRLSQPCNDNPPQITLHNL